MKTFSGKSFLCFAMATMIALSVWAAPAKSIVAMLSPEGVMRVEFDGEEFGQMVPGVFEDGWTMSQLEAGQTDKPAADGVRRGTVTAQSGGEVTTELRIAPVKDGQKFSYKLTPKEKMKLNSLFVRLNVAADSLAGGSYVADGEDAKFPKDLDQVSLKEGDMKSLKITDPKGNVLQFDFPAATPLVVQDDRKWSERFVIHIGPRMSDAEDWPAGKSVTIEFTLTSPKGISAKDE